MSKKSAQRTPISVQAKANTVETRTETFNGVEYTVVPVVMLVEGPLQGMNASAPELALAEEFGRFVDGWNGRPLVMGHPVVDGTPVSANSPPVLEEYSFGYIFNAALDGKKLTGEAWIDRSRADAVEGLTEILEAIDDGENIELSTGLYTQLEAKKGRYNSKPYAGVWRNIVPDHLAFLPEGVKGACSNEDGCGLALNVKSGKQEAGTKDGWRIYSSLTTSKESPKAHDCGCGGTCGGCGGDMPKHDHNHSHDDDDKPVTMSGLQSAIQSALAAVGFKPQQEEQPSTELEGESEPIEHEDVPSSAVRAQMAQASLGFLRDNALPSNLMVDDARKLLASALRQKVGGSYYMYILAFNTEEVVYENSSNGWPYETFAQGYTISDDLSITFNGEPRKVVLTTTITDVVVNADPDNGDGQMTKPNANAQGGGGAETTEAPPVTPPVASEAPRALSAQEYIEQAPPEVREVLETSMRVHAERKNELIQGILKANKDAFSEDELKAQSLPQLEKLAKLAKVDQPRPTFEGLSTNIASFNNAGNDDDNAPPPPPKVLQTPADRAKAKTQAA
jgi:hypothetical protein